MDKVFEKDRSADRITGSAVERDEAAITKRIEEKIDRDLMDSFPASDPPGWTLGIERRV